MSSNDLLAGDELNQFRLVRFQVYNWGTFSNLHDIAISQEGHLFIGGSGSGKSTLLDAMSVLLTPGQAINFNAAAREGEKRSDRSIISYMRGAWTTQPDAEGRSAVQYLRSGSTWSAIALTYKNSSQTVSLMFIGLIRGRSVNTEAAKRNYYVVDGEVNIEDLEEFSKDYDWGVIKKKLPEARVFHRFAPYSECFRKIFGIEEETVLRLLHKAQSARNLGDLNQFLRSFMLDRPKTFDTADLLVDEFTELYAAHESVVKAREQLQCLNRARESYESCCKARQDRHLVKQLTETLPTWFLTQKQTLLEVAVDEALKILQLSEAEYQDASEKVAAQEIEVDRLQGEFYNKGGSALADLEKEIKHEQTRKTRIEQNRERLQQRLSVLHLSVPDTQQAYETLSAQLELEREKAQEALDKLQDKRDALAIEREKVSEEYERIDSEIKVMEHTRSNIPAQLHHMRSELATALGLEEADLPFAGELLDVGDEHRIWQGAIERVLHNFGLSILVDERYYKAFAAIVNDRHLGTRLVYHKVVDKKEKMPIFEEGTIPEKLLIKEGPWQTWLARELFNRFSYTCVKETAALAYYERAVTLTGQIKHNRTRHEKDDRKRLTDRSTWVLGFSNEDKLTLYREEAQRLQAQIKELRAQIQANQTERNRLENNKQWAASALDWQFDEIDLTSVVSRLLELTKRFEDARANNLTLDRIGEDLARAKMQLKTLGEIKQKAFSDLEAIKRDKKAWDDELTQVRYELQGKELEEQIGARLDQQADARTKKRTLKNLSAVRDALSSNLNKSAEDLYTKASEYWQATEKEFVYFKGKWPENAQEVDTSEASASEYFQWRDQLEAEGLPTYEGRFKELLNTQIRQTLVDLYSQIDEERRTIKQRMREVNESLSHVDFNRFDDGVSHLRIRVTDRHLVEVDEFKALQSEVVASDSLDLTNEACEEYFAKINELVQKLKATNKDTAALRWRERVLDVREHMDFQGVEYQDTESGENILEVYQSGTGKSGGQRQKLTVVCLAAALRYQLGGRESDYPSYAPVILDEAFDKADSEFTDIALSIFRDFHFQMIIATPEKSVMTLDPYVGGITYVSCKNRNVSGLINVVYDAKSGEFKELTQGDGHAS